MSESQIDDKPTRPQAPASARADELMELLEAYNETTQRLERSHALLQQEVSRLTAELGEKNRELARKNRLEALGEMAAGVAHEIRNPLGGIEVTMGLLARRLEGDPELGKLADRIFGGIATMNRIIEGMLDFTSDRTVHRTVCAVEDVVMPAAAEVADMAERAGVMLEASLGEAGEAAIEADVEMMVRVFSNLLRNAIEATPEGGRVTVSAWCGEDEQGRPTVTVSVSDTGHGIAKDLRERIFNPFFTTRDTGIGLGLAIVHRTVIAHEGVLRAENDAEGGACFSVELRSCGVEKS